MKKAKGIPKEVRDTQKKLAVLKNDVEEIRAAYKIYCEYFTEYSKDGVCAMIAEESGKAKSTIWNIITFQSIYESRGIKGL